MLEECHAQIYIASCGPLKGVIWQQIACNKINPDNQIEPSRSEIRDIRCSRLSNVCSYSLGSTSPARALDYSSEHSRALSDDFFPDIYWESLYCTLTQVLFVPENESVKSDESKQTVAARLISALLFERFFFFFLKSAASHSQLLSCVDAFS